MRIDDVCKLLGKSRFEVEEMLRASDVIELNLSERKTKHRGEDDELRIFE